MNKTTYWLLVFYFACSNIWIWSVVLKVERHEFEMYFIQAKMDELELRQNLDMGRSRSVRGMKTGRHYMKHLDDAQ